MMRRNSTGITAHPTNAMNDLHLAGKTLSRARQDLCAAKDRARAAAVAAHSEGVYETAIAATLGVDRMTVRRWLGKRDSRGQTRQQEA